MVIPVASLVRVSTAGQAGEDRGGLPRQRAAIEDAVRRHGLTVVRAFELPGVGGDRVSHTSAWAEIRGMLASGQIKGIACDAVDRLCRASDLDLTVLADLQRHGASIWTPGEVRDLNSATDGLLAGLLALLGGVEKSAITRRAWEGKRARRQAGRWTQALDHLAGGGGIRPGDGRVELHR
jgi:DNA invertase Pin-like site-specific DNA recombinase